MKNLFIGNWKLNPITSADACELATAIKENLAGFSSDNLEVVLAPPSPYLHQIATIIKGSNCGLAAQNCAQYIAGAYTGEVSAEMLRDLGVSYVILGHSERRTLFGETNAHVATKLKRASDSSLTPIVCIGESEVERVAGQAEVVVLNQLRASVPLDYYGSLVLAYEPVWSIGTGKTCSAQEAERICKLLRSELENIYGVRFADSVRILYGGSVKASNVTELMRQNSINGVLVGGASLQVAEFTQLVRNGSLVC